MAKRINIIHHDTLEDFHKIITKTQNLELRYRLLAIEKVLADATISSKQICKDLFINTNTFFKWLKWYNEGGIEKLKKGEGGKGFNGGVPKKYSDEAFEALKIEINENQDMVWTLEKMQYFLKEKFNLEPTIQAIRYRIKETHSYKSSRPYPYKGDRDKLGRFKKTL
jgi:transposase